MDRRVVGTTTPSELCSQLLTYGKVKHRKRARKYRGPFGPPESTTDLRDRDCVRVPFDNGLPSVSSLQEAIRARGVPLVVHKIEFFGCSNPLVLKVVHVVPGEVKYGMMAPVEYDIIDADPFLRDAWWAVDTQKVERRYVHLTKGKVSLERVLTRNAFQDAEECLHKGSGYAYLCPPEEIRPDGKVPWCLKHNMLVGVPQRAVNSGICWYASVCLAFFTHPGLREYVLRSYPPDMASWARNALYQRKDAEALRHKMFYDYHVGDDPRQPPTQDGQNGVTQMLVLFAKLGVKVDVVYGPTMTPTPNDLRDKKGTLCRFDSSPPRPGEGHVFIVRCFRTRWMPKRWMAWRGRTYQMISFVIGSEHCRHQIGASTMDETCTHWVSCCADASYQGVSPVFWRFKREYTDQQFWDQWRKLLFLTVFHDGVCDFSPTNRTKGAADGKVSDSEIPGVVNYEVIYFSKGK